MAKQCVFLIGGARSGKSRFAQEFAEGLGGKVLFVATGEALDEEMQTRIEEHKRARPESWRTLETPTDVGKQIEEQIGDAGVVIIDCLTLLVSNLLRAEIDYPEAEKLVLAEINQLITCMNKMDARFIIVSNEVGMGLVPETTLGRIYRDLLGKVNQLVAQRASDVYLMTAGIPLKMKGR